MVSSTLHCRCCVNCRVLLRLLRWRHKRRAVPCGGERYARKQWLKGPLCDAANKRKGLPAVAAIDGEAEVRPRGAEVNGDANSEGAAAAVGCDDRIPPTSGGGAGAVGAAVPVRSPPRPEDGRVRYAGR